MQFHLFSQEKNAAYDEYGVQKELIKDLKWFADRRRFDSDTTYGFGGNSSQYQFLENCCLWLTRQKIDVTFEIPLTTSTCGV